MSRGATMSRRTILHMSAVTAAVNVTHQQPMNFIRGTVLLHPCVCICNDDLFLA